MSAPALVMDQALRQVELLTGLPDTPVCLRLIHDHDRSAPAAKLFGAVEQVWPQIERAQAEGYGVFVVVNEGGHRDSEITRVRAAFIDADDRLMPATWHVAPDFIVKRDATHWHAYWLVYDLPVGAFTEAQRRLASHYGTDPTVCNLSRVMRLGGTLHQKEAK